MTFTYERYEGDAPTGGAEFLAGGTDLLTLVRSGVHIPEAVVDLKSERGPAATIERTETGWRIGAGTTLAMIEDHPGLATDAAVLCEAAASAATRQIRNRATIAGNLLQRSRCSYFRDQTIPCWLKGGNECPARSGLHEHHAVADTGPCITTHPSDPASALVALGANAIYRHERGPVRASLTDLLAAPTDADRRLHRLPAGAVIEHLEFETPTGPSTYLKAMDRAAWQFALVGVAAVRNGDDAAVVASGIAAVPYPLTAVSDALAGNWTPSAIERAAHASSDGLLPGERSRYKLPLLQGLVRRSLERLC